MKIRLLIFSLTFSLGLQAQNFAGQAFYQSKTTVDMDNFGREGMSEDMKKQIMSRMKSFLEKTYILTFNGSESLYKEEASLEVETQGRGFAVMMARIMSWPRWGVDRFLVKLVISVRPSERLM